MQYQAVVFDMDGVIFDTERLVIEFWKEVAKKHNIPNIEHTCIQCLGTIVYVLGKYFWKITVQIFPLIRIVQK